MEGIVDCGHRVANLAAVELVKSPDEVAREVVGIAERYKESPNRSRWLQLGRSRNDGAGAFEVLFGLDKERSSEELTPVSLCLSSDMAPGCASCHAYCLGHVNERIFAFPSKVERLGLILGVRQMHPKVLKELLGLSQIGVLVSHVG